MEDRDVRRERAQNLWTSFARKFEPIAQATALDAMPDFDLSQVGGLEGPKDEIQTYACAATNPEVYARWGTWPPSGLMLIGRPGVGKTMLAEALASLTQTSFLRVAVPRLVIEVIHRGGKVGELVQGWSQTLAEMPPLTVLFNELDVDAFFLEYDDERSGDFAPLRFVPDGKTVVLGLVTSKFPELEPVGELTARIDDAARHVAIDDLCLSPQCGFASTEEGNLLAEEEQWQKLALIVDIANEVWG